MRLSLCFILITVCFAAMPAWAEEAKSDRSALDCRYASNEEATRVVKEIGWRRFPGDDLFRPLLGDPKQTQFVISRLRVKPDGADDIVAGWVVYGENFGIFRYAGERACNGGQINIQGGVFSQFNLSTPSSDLVNADYVVALPITFRLDRVAGRLRLYHQSSHLGDEFLLGTPGITRVNLSFEELELLLSTDWRAFRIYGGGGWLVAREPALERGRWQYGVESRVPISAIPFLGFLSTFDFVVFGADVKALGHHDYDRDVSIKAGFELTSARSVRRFRVLFDYYRGFAPFGQFYDFRMRALGVEVNFGF